VTLPVKTYVVPADYCLAIVDAAAYPSFVSGQWDLDDIRRHFVEQMRCGTMLAWGTGAPANWRLQVGGPRRFGGGYREFTGRIRASEGVLHLVSYDELTMAAQFADERLPGRGVRRRSVRLPAGQYDCRVVQLFDPVAADSRAVFEQKTPHYAVILKRARGAAPPALRRVPWFLEGVS
jgi:hypothetical protein